MLHYSIYCSHYDNTDLIENFYIFRKFHHFHESQNKFCTIIASFLTAKAVKATKGQDTIINHLLNIFYIKLLMDSRAGELMAIYGCKTRCYCQTVLALWVGAKACGPQQQHQRNQ